MKTATVDTLSTTGALLNQERLTYGYDATGIRVSALDQVDSNGDGTWDQQIQTEYLNDPRNFTGYSQVLHETHTDVTTGRVTKVIDYTIGLDGIAQNLTTYANGQLLSRVTDIFGHDGHGSVRALTDITAAIAQLYMYDAYGKMLAIFDGAGQLISTNAANALTTLLYSGQQFDSDIGMQYLRARYYDPAAGRFHQLDPFFGDIQNPESFHKYAYVLNNPIDLTDPSGRIPKTPALGRAVHTFIIADYLAHPIPGLLRFGDVKVATIANALNPALGLPGLAPNGDEPDLVEVTPVPGAGIVAELKPVNLTIITWADLVLPAWQWGLGVTAYPGLRPWPGFTNPAVPPGYTLWTINNGVPGAIIYDFFNIPQPNPWPILDPLNVILNISFMTAAAYMVYQMHLAFTIAKPVQVLAKIPQAVGVNQELEKDTADAIMIDTL
jgi:RHS repeat-associated protein